MRMVLSGHQFFWAFADSFGAVAAKEGAVIEEELQQVEIGRAQLTAEGKIVAQPRVEVFDERTGAWNVFHRLDHGVGDALEFPGKLLAQ